MNNLKLLGEQININLSDEKLEKFFQYKEMLKEWNEKINLTAIIEDEEIKQILASNSTEINKLKKSKKIKPF